MSEESKKSKKEDKKKNEKSEQKEEQEKQSSEKDTEKHEKPIILKAEAYKTIILYASRYANQNIPSSEWKEIYGVLIGWADNDFVYVERAEALTYGHATDVQLEPRHYIFIDEIQQKPEVEGKGFYVVGWFHSHPGLNLFFSYIDLLNQLGFQQNNPDFCGLVFDHTLLGKKKEEIIKGEDGTEHSITKFETGFEIYRLNDVNMDINSPGFDVNYHKIDYIVDGLNKFFFANVLVELSALYTSEKPLQAAYGEVSTLESNYKEPSELEGQTTKAQSESNLTEIPVSEDMDFDFDDFFYDKPDKEKDQITRIKKEAEQLIFEGNQAFGDLDAFTGVEKYRNGIEKYKQLEDYDRILDLLRIIAERCFLTNHDNLAEEFAEQLYNLAKERNELFYIGEGNYLMGYLVLKKGWSVNLEKNLKRVQEASINFEQAGDFAGAGQCYYKIGTIYYSRLKELFNAGLFYIQAIISYNQAVLESHPLRTSLWAKAENLINKISDLRDIIEEIIPNIEDANERNKLKKDFNSIKYNF